MSQNIARKKLELELELAKAEVLKKELELLILLDNDTEDNNNAENISDDILNNVSDISLSDGQDNWVEYNNVNVFGGDDYYKLPSSTHIDVVKNKCKELGSRVFVTKDNCQFYIRSPPSVKNNRDYNSIKNKIDERISLEKFSTYKTYLLDY